MKVKVMMALCERRGSELVSAASANGHAEKSMYNDNSECS